MCAANVCFNRHAAEFIDAAADFNRRELAVAQDLAHLLRTVLIKALVLLEFLRHVAEHLRRGAEMFFDDGAHLFGAHTGAFFCQKLAVFAVYGVSQLHGTVAARQKRHIKVAAFDFAALPQRIRKPRERFLRLVAIFAPAHCALAAPGANLLRRAAVHMRQVSRRGRLQLFRDAIYGIRCAAHGFRRIPQAQNNVFSKRIARQPVPVRGE